MFEVHISKHSLFRLKITVGCRLCTCPSIHFSLDEDTLKITVGCRLCTYLSIHFFVSRSRSAVDCARVQAFTFLLTKTLSRSRSVVDCAHIRAFATKTLKITVGCLTSTYPSIHLLLVLELSRSRSVARCAQIQAFATKTCTRVGLLGPSGKHAGYGHVDPCCRLCLCRRSTALV